MQTHTSNEENKPSGRKGSMMTAHEDTRSGQREGSRSGNDTGLKPATPWIYRASVEFEVVAKDEHQAANRMRDLVGFMDAMAHYYHESQRFIYDTPHVDIARIEPVQELPWDRLPRRSKYVPSGFVEVVRAWLDPNSDANYEPWDAAERLFAKQEASAGMDVVGTEVA